MFEFDDCCLNKMRVYHTHRFNSLCGIIDVVIVILNVYFCRSISVFTEFSTHRWNRKSFRFRFSIEAYTTNIHICGEIFITLITCDTVIFFLLHEIFIRNVIIFQIYDKRSVNEYESVCQLRWKMGQKNPPNKMVAFKRK